MHYHIHTVFSIYIASMVIMYLLVVLLSDWCWEQRNFAWECQHTPGKTYTANKQVSFHNHIQICVQTIVLACLFVYYFFFAIILLSGAKKEQNVLMYAVRLHKVDCWVGWVLWTICKSAQIHFICSLVLFLFFHGWWGWFFQW